MRMQIQKIWIANDGTRFTSQDECRRYEARSALQTIITQIVTDEGKARLAEFLLAHPRLRITVLAEKQVAV